MNSFNKINKKNNKNIKEAVQRSGDPRPMDCKRNPVTPFQETGTSSSMTCLMEIRPRLLFLARADKMSAILKPPQGVTTTSANLQMSQQRLPLFLEQSAVNRTPG
ncbi:hypothetical protein EVAR_91126_1 [Eumeta japonica]|uniref:Uncharacterized protein n=1 Tax=Eumeta variegata TaxID=151549 RepID=A0A4C1SFY5_EUMVA|nr:hypothetical protein EVAR_91126_1 [Eumeta japonica]